MRSAALSAAAVAARPPLDPGQQVVQDVLGGSLVGGPRPTDVASSLGPVEVHQPADPVPAEVAWPQVPALGPAALGPAGLGEATGIRTLSGIGRAGRLARRWMGYH